MSRWRVHVAASLGLLLLAGGCASNGSSASGPRPAAAAAGDEAWQRLPAPDHTLAHFRRGGVAGYCYDRGTQPYTAVVDAHMHPRPFGGSPIPPAEMLAMLDRLGVRFVNYFGIGQVLELAANCDYYLDCPGVAARPSIKNDFVNGMDVAALDPDKVHVTLSMTFMDLAHPDDIVPLIELYDREFPGMFSWSGELNVIKQALLPNRHEPATIESIERWKPFMAVLRERGIPVTLHADLGNDAEPTKYLYLMEHVLERYPDNKIVWAHMGLSKELGDMDPDQHVAIMRRLLDRYPNLWLDISWDVLYQQYHQWGDVFIPFFNDYSTRILPGTDFVAAGSKPVEQYARELEVTSRALRFLDDEAFRNIALGQNYFDLLGLDFVAPPICGAGEGPSPDQGSGASAASSARNAW